MIHLRFQTEATPTYMTSHSAGADLRANAVVEIAAGGRSKVPTGVWIASFDEKLFPTDTIPELQIRARSSLAWKHGIMLANGVGTIDVDYRDEICVLLLNTSTQDYTVQAGERVAQLVLALTYRIPGLPVGQERTGGFGSTGK